MALDFEFSIDLTQEAGNPEPKRVEQMSMAHGPDGELTQFYVPPSSSVPGDKSTQAVGVYDEETGTWSYADYDSLTWKGPEERLTGEEVDRLAVKAFPGLGACAAYQLKGQLVSRVKAPVFGEEGRGGPPPSLTARVTETGGILFSISPPQDEAYECWRVVLDRGDYSEEHITYETEFTAPGPALAGTYSCYVIGYADDVQVYSQKSATVEVTVTEGAETWSPPYYSKDEITEMAGSRVTVDAELSDNSENPVENRAITGTMLSGAQRDKMYKLGFYLDENGNLSYDREENG